MAAAVEPARVADVAGERGGTWRADLAGILGLFALLSAAYWAAVLLVAGRAGFPLDDAYIHLQFARHLFEDGQMAFNRGVPSSGSTAPLYPVLLAGLYALVRNWYLASAVLGALASAGTALAVYGILRSWTGRRDVARWGGLLTVLASPTVIQAYGGMEAPVYSLLFLAGLWLYGLPGRRWLGGAVFALGIGLRPEFVLLWPLTLLERAVALRDGRGERVKTGIVCVASWLRGAVLPSALTWLPVLAVYAGYHWWQDGQHVPSTFGAKAVAAGVFRPSWLNGLPAALRQGDPAGVLLAVLVWPLLVLLSAGIGLGVNCAPLAFGLKEGLAAGWRASGPAAAGRRLAVLVLVGYPLLRGLVDPASPLPYQFQRYFAHLTPLLILIVLGALPGTGAVVQRRFWNWRDRPWGWQRRRTLAWASAGLLGTGTLAVGAVWNITSMQVPLGEWVRAHTEPGQLVATNDIGAIGFFSRRPILDTIGLVEPELVAHRLAGGSLEDYLARRRPAYVIIFPEWYADLAARPERFERVHAARVPLNFICGGPELVVYRPRWP